MPLHEKGMIGMSGILDFCEGSGTLISHSLGQLVISSKSGPVGGYKK